MTAPTAVDRAKVDAAAERVLGEVNSAMTCLNLYLGDSLGLFDALVEHGPCTPEQLAKETGYNERYLREWLECMAAGRYAEHDGKGSFSLPAELAVVLANSDDPAYAAPFLHWAPSVAGALAPLIKAFSTGGGVPYEAYGEDAITAIGAGNKPMFVHDYVTKWIPTMPDIEAKLKDGARVADIGCGVGWSSIALVSGFAGVHIDALDLDQESIRQAKENAAEAGVADRITFHVAAAEDTGLSGSYDLVTAFECIHDMAYPVQALEQMRKLVASDGAVLIADEAAGDSLEENTNFLGHFFYNFSVLHCLPQAMIFPDSAATGTVMRPSLMRQYATEAGFSNVDILPIENAFWHFYRLTP